MSVYYENGLGCIMDSKFESVKYVVAEQLKKGVQKHNIGTAKEAKAIIDSAEPTDMLELRVTINSPMQIIKAVNISKNPDKLFGVVD